MICAFINVLDKGYSEVAKRINGISDFLDIFFHCKPLQTSIFLGLGYWMANCLIIIKALLFEKRRDIDEI